MSRFNGHWVHYTLECAGPWQSQIVGYIGVAKQHRMSMCLHLRSKKPGLLERITHDAPLGLWCTMHNWPAAPAHGTLRLEL